MVQNIPYDFSASSSTGGSMKYPYQVLYENTGVCGEKSVLLAYLLRGLGYDVVLFDFKPEKHMAVGIKSPAEYSFLGSGYAFVESTKPSIITDSEGTYGGGEQLVSVPGILHVSNGRAMTTLSEEYADVTTWRTDYSQMNQIGEKYGRVLDAYEYGIWKTYRDQWMSINNKYGIEVITR